ncbi:sigma-70 family RNA polymerase sigma factor [Lentzea roselyniae]
MHSSDWAHALEQAVRRCQAAGLSRAEAEDCAHEAVLVLLARQGAGERIDSPASWLVVVAYRQAIDHMRRSGRECAALGRLTVRDGDVPTPDEVVTDRALARWLAGAVDTLPPMTRRVCLAMADGSTITQAAADLGLTRRSVESHLTRARRFLRGLAAGAAAVLAGTACRFGKPGIALAATVPVAALSTSVILLPHTTTTPPDTASPTTAPAEPVRAAASPGQVRVVTAAEAIPAVASPRPARLAADASPRPGPVPPVRRGSPSRNATRHESIGVKKVQRESFSAGSGRTERLIGERTVKRIPSGGAGSSHHSVDKKGRLR